jgi:hypothetical protein
MIEEGSMSYTLDPLGLMIDTSGPASLIVPVPESPVNPPLPEVMPEPEPATEAIRPEELGANVDVSV